MRNILIGCLVSGCLGLGIHAEEGSSPRRRPLSTPRVYDQAPTVLPAGSLFQAAPVRSGREDSPGDSIREAVPRNRALDLQTQPIAPLGQPQTDRSSDQDSREEERGRSWLRPVDFLGEEDLPPLEADEVEGRQESEEEVMDWGSLREMMAAREQDAEDLRGRAERESADAQQEGENDAFSIRDRTVEGMSMDSVQMGRDPRSERMAGEGSGGSLRDERVQSSAVLPSSMRIEPIAGGSPDRQDTRGGAEAFTRERTRHFGNPEENRVRFSESAGSRPAMPSENRWERREPMQVHRTLVPASSAGTGGFTPAMSGGSPGLPQSPAASPGIRLPNQAPSTPGLDIRRFRPDEFSIRSSDSR